MPRPRNLTPTYAEHKQSGRGRLIWTDTAGVHHEKLLPGAYGSEESLAAKARLELELATSPTRAPIDSKDITVAELMAAYLAHAARYYVDADGTPTYEFANMKVAIKPVRELYAETLAAEFGPRALAAVRQHMVGLGWCRSLINHNIDRIRRAMKWAASEELIPVATYQALRTLAGLRRGRTDARESEPVKPVSDEVVKATLPHLPHQVRVMVELMMHTGMRPGEVVAMTLNQIDRGGDVWKYRPAKHKTAHHGKERVIPLGPNARAVLAAFLVGRVLEPNEPIFSPRRAREERFARLRENRKSEVQPSQVSRKKRFLAGVGEELEEWAEELARTIRRLEREAAAVTRLLDGKAAGKRAARLFPGDGRDERIAKYERHLHTLLTSTLHELERLQARREGEAVPPPAVAELTVTVDAGSS